MNSFINYSIITFNLLYYCTLSVLQLTEFEINRTRMCNRGWIPSFSTPHVTSWMCSITFRHEMSTFLFPSLKWLHDSICQYSINVPGILSCSRHVEYRTVRANEMGHLCVVLLSDAMTSLQSQNNLFRPISSGWTGKLVKIVLRNVSLWGISLTVESVVVWYYWVWKCRFLWCCIKRINYNETTDILTQSNNSA
jgi:hypothetical protein